MFKTQYSPDRPRPKSVPGSGVKTLYSPEFDKQGRMTLVESGKEDLYGYIQSHRDSVDIKVLLTRYQNGDVSALTRAQAFYMDTTGMPKSYSEFLNRMHEGRNHFDRFPAEVRARFNNDFNQFLAAMDSPDFVSMLSVKQPEQVQETVKEVATDES